MDVITLVEAMARRHGLTFTARAHGHYQIRGAILVNWYPNSRLKKMYVSGTTTGISNATPTQIIDAAIGKRLPEIPTANRRKSYIAVKRRLYARSEFCHWCPKHLTFEEATVDHVIPLSRGGLNNMNNMVLACQPCNCRRANSIPTKEQK